jgi:hypothetical protein
MSCPINPPLFDHPNNTWQKVLIIKVAPPLYNCIQPPFTSFLLIQDAVISCSLRARDQLSRPFRTKCICIPEGYNFVCKCSKWIMFINEHTFFYDGRLRNAVPEVLSQKEACRNLFRKKKSTIYIYTRVYTHTHICIYTKVVQKVKTIWL